MATASFVGRNARISQSRGSGSLLIRSIPSPATGTSLERFRSFEVDGFWAESAILVGDWGNWSRTEMEKRFGDMGKEAMRF